MKTNTELLVKAKFKGYTDDGLAILSIGTVDNYLLTFDPEDVGVPKPDKTIRLPRSKVAVGSRS